MRRPSGLAVRDQTVALLDTVDDTRVEQFVDAVVARLAYEDRPDKNGRPRVRPRWACAAILDAAGAEVGLLDWPGKPKTEYLEQRIRCYEIWVTETRSRTKGLLAAWTMIPWLDDARPSSTLAFDMADACLSVQRARQHSSLEEQLEDAIRRIRELCRADPSGGEHAQMMDRVLARERIGVRPPSDRAGAVSTKLGRFW